MTSKPLKIHSAAVVFAATIALLFPIPGKSETLIRYKRLADEQNVPFKAYGKIVRTSYPRDHPYQVSILKYPNVNSCILANQGFETEFMTLDWKVMKSIQDIDVCIFRILSSIDDVNGARVWLKSESFSLGNLKSANMQMPRQYGSLRKKYTSYSATLSKPDFINKIGNSSIFGNLAGVYGISIEVIVGYGSQIESIGTSINSL